jgi:hypothetical protein
VPPDLNSRGLSLWSFETERLDTVLARWDRYAPGRPRTPRELSLPGVGPARAVLLPMPDGFPVEVYERR